MIGNLDDARLAWDKSHGKRPKGWRKIGAGVSREAYLAPSGVVYKVATRGKDYNLNEHEAFKRYRRWKSLPKVGVYIPESTLYHVNTHEVLAMPYFKKCGSLRCGSLYWPFTDSCDCKPESRPNRMCHVDLIDWLSQRGMDDLHEDNMRLTENGRIYVIDLGHNERY